MGIFSRDPDQEARRAQRQAAEARRAAAEAFKASPAGRARAARRAGRQIFQVDLPLSTTQGRVVPMFAAFATTSEAIDGGSVIEAIEREGWRLENVGYIYRITGSVSRDKFMASGQQEAVHGEIVGIYLFRAFGEAPGVDDVEDVEEGRVTFDAR